MVTMTSSSARPPAGLEYKGAPTMLAPRPGPAAVEVGSAARSGVTEVDGAGQVVALVAVTGTVDDVTGRPGSVLLGGCVLRLRPGVGSGFGGGGGVGGMLWSWWCRGGCL